MNNIIKKFDIMDLLSQTESLISRYQNDFMNKREGQTESLISRYQNDFMNQGERR